MYGNDEEKKAKQQFEYKFRIFGIAKKVSKQKKFKNNKGLLKGTLFKSCHNIFGKNKFKTFAGLSLQPMI